MNYKKATIPQRIAAFLITYMLTFSIVTLIYPLATSYPTLYLLILTSYLIFLCLFYSKSSSPGKFILNLKVISAKDNKPARFLHMFLRETFGKLLSSFFYIGYIYTILNKENLALHDVIFKTYVIKAD